MVLHQKARLEYSTFKYKEISCIFLAHNLGDGLGCTDTQAVLQVSL
jgi:hypothetical protein